ncbi:MAG: hypothetical protein IT582_11710 [Opitutaceae bacterium]|nr:hypothetical protein [Opitutaceae bacterium]
MKPNGIALLLCVTALLLAGCASTDGPGAAAPMAGADEHESFVTMNKAAQAAIECAEIFTRTLPDGRLEVVANLRNTGDYSLRLKTSCVFKDTQGRALKDEAPVLKVEVAAGALETVRFTAPSLAAQHFTVRVSAARWM